MTVFLNFENKYLDDNINFDLMINPDIHKSGIINLNLSNNRFTKFPNFVNYTKFPNLETINLSNNKIIYLDINILSFEKLQQLNLTGNSLFYEYSHSSLKYLNFNSIADLPNWFHNYILLSILNNRKIALKLDESIYEQLNNINNYFKIYYSQYKNIFVRYYIESCLFESELKKSYLNFSGFNLCNSDINDEFIEFCEKYNIKNMNLSHNQLSKLENELNFSNLTNLQELNLSFNNFKNISFVIGDIPHLNQLNIYNNNIDFSDRHNISILKKLEHKNVNIIYENINEDEIVDEPHCVKIVDNLELNNFLNLKATYNEYISTLDLSKRNLLEISKDLIIFLKQHFTKLSNINLSNNKIQNLHEYLREIPTLKKVDLRNNPIDIQNKNNVFTLNNLINNGIEILVDNDIQKIYDTSISINIDANNYIQESHIIETNRFDNSYLANIIKEKQPSLNISKLNEELFEDIVNYYVDDLKHIRVANINSMNLSELPKNLQILNNLDEIYLNDNNIVFLNRDFFQLCKKAKIISLKNNPIKINFNLLNTVLEMNPKRFIFDEELHDLLKLYIRLNEIFQSSQDKLSLNLSDLGLKSFHSFFIEIKNKLYNDLYSLNPVEYYELEHLNLQDNYISELPNLLEEIQSIREINLNNNQFYIIPKVLCKLSNLKTIDLKNNPINIENTENINTCCYLINKGIEVLLDFDVQKLYKNHIKTNSQEIDSKIKELEIIPIISENKSKNSLHANLQPVKVSINQRNINTKIFEIYDENAIKAIKNLINKDWAKITLKF